MDPRPAPHRPRILLAEDDSELRCLLTLALSKAGYDVVAVSDGVELLGQLAASLEDPHQRGQPAVIVSDVRMPGVGGLRVLAALRRARAAVPVILITAFGDEDTHAAARGLGAAAVLDKPFDVADLKAAVRKLAPPV